MKHMSEEAKKMFFEAVLSLKTEAECDAFFEDICTIMELHDIFQRMQVAVLLDSGKKYKEIAEITGASTATICRVNKCVEYGSGGYRTVLDRMKENEGK